MGETDGTRPPSREQVEGTNRLVQSVPAVQRAGTDRSPLSPGLLWLHASTWGTTNDMKERGLPGSEAMLPKGRGQSQGR